jgi:CDP-glucose 4,6-dehydratase
MNFWKNKKVLITGHTGFKGSWLAFYLNYLGAKIVGYSLKPEKYHKLFKILNIKKNITANVFGDINDKKKILLTIKKFKPEFIFHLAAQPFVIDSFKNPISNYKTNISGTINILESARDLNFLRSVIIATSDKCYKIFNNNNNNIAYKEDSHLGGDDPYSASKACAEIIANSYAKSFFKKNTTNISTVRSGNILGGGDWGKNRLIPDIIKSFKNKKKINIRNINSVRPWTYILDTLTGYLLVAQKNYYSDKYLGAWNFSSKHYYKKTVESIIEYAVSRNFLKKKNILLKKQSFKETHLLAIDSKKAKKFLGWAPKLNFYETLEYTFEWYKKYFQKENMEMFTLYQLKKYLKKKKLY